MKIAVCDDELIICQKLTELITDYPQTEPVSIKTFISGDDLLKSSDDFDLVFLDIQLPGIDGLAVGEQLLRKDPDLILVLISSSFHYISQSYHIRTFQFMLKPIEKDFFAAEFKRCLQKYQSTRGNYTIISQREEVKLPIKDIVYIQSDLRESLFYLANGRKYATYRKLSDVAAELEGFNFLRCHKSYLVNLRWIIKYRKKELTIRINNQDKILPISRHFQESFAQQYGIYRAKRS